MKLFAAALATVALYAQVPQSDRDRRSRIANRPRPGCGRDAEGSQGPDRCRGIATVTIPLGPLSVTVWREGFLPASTTLDVDAPKE
jgi:hypothetical protein